MGVAGDSINVLHVDDDPEFAEMVATFVEREDERLSVTTARSTEGVLDRLDGVDCVVSDYDMPGRNGIELLEAVREECPGLPFVLYTGKGSEEVASDAISAGVTDYLQKESGTGQYTVLANRIGNAVEKHRTKAELADREKRLNLFFEQSPLGVVEWNEEFEFVRLNESAEGILGYSEEELVGRSWEAIVPDSDRAAVEAVVSDLLEDEGGYHTVNENVRKDGQRVVCEWHNWVVTDADDEVIAVFSQFEDVTEREERKRELERYEAYLQESTDVITVLDESGTIEYESPSVARVLGYEPGELIGRNGFEFVHPDDRDRVEAAFDELLSEPGATATIECRFRTADDEWRWLEVRGTNQSGNDQVDGVVTNSRDITGRKEQERKRERIIQRATDAIVEVDADWRFTLINEQAEALYDMDEESLLGRDFWEVFAGARDTRFEAEYRDVMESREPTSFTEQYDGLDGWFDIDVYPKDDGGLAFYFRKVTDRIQRSRELERRNERFAYVERVADIGYWEIDAQTPWPHDVTLSDGVYRIHELPPEEPFDVERGLGFYHPEDRPRVRADVERAIADGEPYDHEVRLVTATGEERWVHSVAQPVEEDGEVVSVRGVLQDVTDRKRQERALRRERDRREALFENAPAPVIAGSVREDGEHRITDANDAFEDVFGFETGEIVGEDVAEVVVPDGGMDTHGRLRERSAAGEPVVAEVERVTADGPRQFLLTVVPYGMDGEAADGWYAWYTDVSGRRERERVIEELHSTADALMEAGTDGEVAEITVDAVRDILGLPANAVHLYDESAGGLAPAAWTAETEEIVGEPPTFVPGEGIAGTAFETGEPQVHGDISTVPERFNPDTDVRSQIALPLGDHGVLLIGSPEADAFDDADVSLVETLAAHATTALERVEREQALSRQNEQLAEFASVVSHDLRSPLNVAQGRLELAREECDSEHLDDAAGALDRSLALIDDLLSLAREGEPVGEAEAVDLAEVCAGCWRHVETADATLAVETDRTIRAEPGRLKQLLENLMGNAVEHGSTSNRATPDDAVEHGSTSPGSQARQDAVEHGGADVTVTVGDLPDGFYVADDGPGIPEDERQAVFEAGHSTTADGTGFGLTIVGEIADAHGWDVRVTESEDGGARFEITGVEFA